VGLSPAGGAERKLLEFVRMTQSGLLWAANGNYREEPNDSRSLPLSLPPLLSVKEKDAVHLNVG